MSRPGTIAAASCVGGLGAAYALARLDRPAWREPARLPSRAGPLAVTSLGDGRPLLLLHGLVGSGRFWGASYDTLAQSHRLLVPDLLGFGRSDRPDRGYRPDEHADAVAEALVELGVDEPSIIGAHSFGTVVALRLASRHSHLVDRITAFGPPLYASKKSAMTRIGAASPMARLFVLRGGIAERTCHWVCDHRSTAATAARWASPRLPPALAADAVEHTWRSYSETLDRCLLTGAPATWLDEIDVPVRLVAGTRDRVVDHEFLDQLRRRSGTLRVEHWEGDHRLPLTDPQRCIDAILR